MLRHIFQYERCWGGFGSIWQVIWVCCIKKLANQASVFWSSLCLFLERLGYPRQPSPWPAYSHDGWHVFVHVPLQSDHHTWNSKGNHHHLASFCNPCETFQCWKYSEKFMSLFRRLQFGSRSFILYPSSLGCQKKRYVPLKFIPCIYKQGSYNTLCVIKMTTLCLEQSLDVFLVILPYECPAYLDHAIRLHFQSCAL